MMKINIKDHLSIARPDHWAKNVMVLPGAFLAFAIENRITQLGIINLALAVFATCLIASANYTINEYLDRNFDKHHPVKSQRALVQRELRASLVFVQYILLGGVGLTLLAFQNTMCLIAGMALLFMGLIYNVPPIRSKDVPFIDVISESINNPIRLLIGWAAISTIIMPPISLIISYWFGGAFLMATKRYAEYRFIDDPGRAKAYRKSFKGYSEVSLLGSAFFYAITCAFFLGIFLIKYRVEFLITFPFIAFMFVWYLAIASNRDEEVVRQPEKIYQNKKFFMYTLAVVFLIFFLFFFDIPSLHYLTDHSVIKDLRV